MEYYRRFLPHYFIPGLPVFITTRLHGSLPKHVILDLIQKYETESTKLNSLKNEKLKLQRKLEIEQKYFLKYDELLNHYNHRVNWLADQRVAHIVADSLHWGNKRKYQLFAFTIMTNHVHIVLEPILPHDHNNTPQKPIYVLSGIMESFKKFTAREANQVLGRTGQFWQRESYDRVVRSEKELHNIIQYILMNPVKANLVEKPEDYPWTYVRL